MDERTLCNRCISDYKDSGYMVQVIYPIEREACEKCSRLGLKVNIEEPSSRHKSTKMRGGSFYLQENKRG